jgi:hypothetical protein
MINAKPLILSGFQKDKTKSTKRRLCPIVRIERAIPALALWQPDVCAQICGVSLRHQFIDIPTYSNAE